MEEVGRLCKQLGVPLVVGVDLALVDEDLAVDLVVILRIDAIKLIGGPDRDGRPRLQRHAAAHRILHRGRPHRGRPHRDRGRLCADGVVLVGRFPSGIDLPAGDLLYLCADKARREGPVLGQLSNVIG